MTSNPKNARIHPEDRARIAALNSASQALRGKPQEKPKTSYYTPALIQCTLPHSDPGTRDWKKTNGDFTLIISSGVDENLEPYGIPYGSFPRLVLAYIITSVVEGKTQQKENPQRIELSNHFGGFLKEIGYSPKTNRRGDNAQSRTIRSQLLRLLRANITFQHQTGDDKFGGLTVNDVKIAPKFSLWWDYRNPAQGTLFESHIDLSEDFYRAILAAPVPLRTDILAQLKRSPLALDVYMWVSYRLFTLQKQNEEQVTLSYGRLQEQFGTGIDKANYRQFRREFRLALKKVADYWVSPDGTKEMLNYELHEDGLTLFRSPLLINVPKRKIAEQAAADEAARIIASRTFDAATLKEARQNAGDWDVKWLANQYFDWIAARGITPKDPRANFMKFIKTHRGKNERQ